MQGSAHTGREWSAQPPLSLLLPPLKVNLPPLAKRKMLKCYILAKFNHHSAHPGQNYVGGVLSPLKTGHCVYLRKVEANLCSFASPVEILERRSRFSASCFCSCLPSSISGVAWNSWKEEWPFDVQAVRMINLANLHMYWTYM